MRFSTRFKAHPGCKRVHAPVAAILLLSVCTGAHADSTDLYVGLAGQGAIGTYTTSGTDLGLFVTNGSGGLYDPQSFKFGPDGNLYVGGYLDNAIKEFNGSTGAFMRNLPTGDSYPFGVAFDGHGDLYVSNFFANTVSQVNLASGLVSHTYTGFDNPTGLLVATNGNLLVSNFSNGVVDSVNISTGIASVFASGLSNLRDGLIYGPGGNLYVLNTGGGAIEKVNTDGSWTPFANINSQYPFTARTDAQSLVYDNGNFYTVISADSDPGVAEYSGHNGAYLGSFALPEANVTGIAIKPASVPSSTPEPGAIGLLTGSALVTFRALKRRRKQRATA